MRIFREIVLWISGIVGFFCMGLALGTFAEFFKSNAFGVYEISRPLGVGLPLLFVCVRLWTLERRAAAKVARAD